jgi:hypothetical protein
MWDYHSKLGTTAPPYYSSYQCGISKPIRKPLNLPPHVWEPTHFLLRPMRCVSICTGLGIPLNLFVGRCTPPRRQQSQTWLHFYIFSSNLTLFHLFTIFLLQCFDQTLICAICSTFNCIAN